MIDFIEKGLRKQLKKMAGKVQFCPKGGQHFCPSRDLNARCVKCGKTIKEIKEEIEAFAKKNMPGLIKGVEEKAQ